MPPPLPDTASTPQRLYPRVGFALVVLYAAISAVNIVAGALTEDEGWYLYASRLVYEGQLPYVDFAFTQPPLVPYVYGLGQLIAPGLLAGRITSCVLGVATLLLAMHIARKLAGDIAGLLAGLLVCTNLFLLHNLSITKTYALGAFLLVAAMCLLVHARRRPWLWFAAGGVFGLAICTRLSAAPVVIVAVLILAVGRVHGGAWRVLAGTAITVSLILGPLCMADPAAFWEHVYHYHTHVTATLPDAIIASNRIHGLTGLLTNWFAPLALLAAAAVLRTRTPRDRDPAGAVSGSHPRAVGRVVILAPLAAVIFHMLPGHPQPEYQSLVGVALAIGAAVAIAPHLARRPTRWYAGGVAAAVLLGAIVGDGPRWDASGGTLPLEEATALRDIVQSHVPEGGTVLTLHSFVAVEAERAVPHGLEMGIFSYFPGQSRPEAARFHRVNDEILQEMVRSGAHDAIVLGNLDLTLDGYMIPTRPALRRTRFGALRRHVERGYRHAGSVDAVGDRHERLDVYVRR